MTEKDKTGVYVKIETKELIDSLIKKSTHLKRMKKYEAIHEIVSIAKNAMEAENEHTAEIY